MAQIHTTRTVSGAPATPAPTWWVDLVVIGLVAAIAYGVVALATRWAAPLTVTVNLNLAWWALPGYAGLSTMRMAVAYVISAAFSLAYARIAIASRSAERFMIPLLDILQSIPILSFMPAVVLGLIAVFPDRNFGLELAAVLLIFTSQAWNMAFSFHQSLVTIPRELNEAARLYRLNFWQRFSRLELPFGLIPFIWNSMMSWAGGWFFLMAAEQFTLGGKDFRLPGLGSYLATAANRGDVGALALGLATLVAVIVILDQLLWRPLVAWSERFKLEQTESAEGVTSWVLTTLRRSALLEWLSDHLLGPVGSSLDRGLTRLFGPGAAEASPSPAVANSERRVSRNVARAALGLI
ncbi:MAG: ABC transporter permease subunit, partial [Chloroflexota bacterium]